MLDAAGNDAAEAVGAERSASPILRLETDAGAPAGSFRLAGEAIGKPRSPGPAQPGDIALVLHTSGTTSRPKIVPLSQRQHRRLGAAHPRDAGARRRTTAASTSCRSSTSTG